MPKAAQKGKSQAIHPILPLLFNTPQQSNKCALSVYSDDVPLEISSDDKVALPEFVLAPLKKRKLGLGWDSKATVTIKQEVVEPKIKQDVGADASGRDFLPFSDLEQSVRDDVATIRRSPLIPQDIPISGAIYDVHSGKLQEVVRA